MDDGCASGTAKAQSCSNDSEPRHLDTRVGVTQCPVYWAQCEHNVCNFFELCFGKSTFWMSVELFCCHSSNDRRQETPFAKEDWPEINEGKDM